MADFSQGAFQQTVGWVRKKIKKKKPTSYKPTPKTCLWAYNRSKDMTLQQFWKKNCQFFSTAGQVQKKWGVLSVMLFIMISGYKSMYGQDRRITLIHMLSANKLGYLDIYFSMSPMDSFWGITLRSMHYTEDTAWHQNTLLRVPLECDISKTSHNRHGKVYIKTFRNFSTLEMCECHSSTLDIGGVVAWNQQCGMTSQKGFIFSEPALQLCRADWSIHHHRNQMTMA